MDLKAQAGVVRNAIDAHALVAARALGPLVIGELHIVGLDRLVGNDTVPAAFRDMMMLCLPTEGVARLHAGGITRRCQPGGGLLLDPGKRWTIDGGCGLRCYIVFLPRVFLALAAPAGVTCGILARTPGLEAVRTLVAAASALDEDLSPREELLAVGALQYLLAAAFVPFALPDRTLALREAGLLQRITAHIDGHLASPLSVPALCAALGCSRSALYRATNPAGGIAELIARRRLAAVYGCLIDAGDRRPIAAIAIAHGFSEPTQFSRRFRRTFGTTARQVRNTSSSALQRVRSVAAVEPIRATTHAYYIL